MTEPGGRSVAVTGSTGLIGRALVAALQRNGDRVVRITRGTDRPLSQPDSDGASDDATSVSPESPGPSVIRWDPEGGLLEGGALEGLDAVVHLAGEPIPALRWTEAKKRAILSSRESGTLLLSRALGGLRRPPGVLVSASAVGFYGDRGDERLTEESSGGTGFLAEVCRRWEGATHVARAMGIRTVHLRTGQALSPEGGVLGTILLPFRAGLGGRAGSGTQYVPWIDLDDVVGLILHAIAHPGVRGPLNATAPAPVTNAAFTDVLGRILDRPTLIPVPALAIRVLLGEMGVELILSGQRALPERALASGYQFRFGDLEDALRHQLAIARPRDEVRP